MGTMKVGGPIVSYDQVARLVFQTPWAILPEVYGVMCQVVAERASGYRPSSEEIKERLGAVEHRRQVPPGAAKNGSIAVLPLLGVLSQRASMMSETSGGTSTDQFGQAFNAAMADSTVSAIVLDVDSPGGSVHGMAELHQVIASARGVKPVVAVANSLMASAAYWVSSAASEVVASPGADVGAIGVITQHADVSAKLEMEGVKVTTISAGRKKSEGDPSQPLGEDALADIQARVNEVYATFANDVADARGVSAQAVRQGFGEGGVVSAPEALNLGMIDRVATLEQTIARLAGTDVPGQPAGRRAGAARRGR